MLASRRRGGISTEASLALGGLGLVACSLLFSDNDGFGQTGLTTAVILYAAVAAIAWAGARSERLESFGAANGVTLVRFALASILAGCATELADRELVAETAPVWLIAGIALTALVTDACDGWLARRLGTASSFGARFDMETDAVLMLVLCVLVCILEKAGAWIVAAGLMRYGFIAAGLLWPVLAKPLSASFRRKLVCALQISALVLMLAPVIPPEASGVIGAAALALLAWSFAMDIAWLVLAARRPKLAA